MKLWERIGAIKWAFPGEDGRRLHIDTLAWEVKELEMRLAETPCPRVLMHSTGPDTKCALKYGHEGECSWEKV